MGILGRITRPVLGLLAIFTWLAFPVPVFAQLTQQRVSSVPGLNPQPEQATDTLTAPDYNSAVSLIDSVFPRSQVLMRVELDYNATRPQRAEYIWAKGIFSGTPGPPRPETRLDSQELSSYVEYAMGSWFSVFMFIPTRWMNPEVNGNAWGLGDSNLGLKFMAYAGEDFQLSLQLRGYLPTGKTDVMGVHHYIVEPALLGHYRLADYLNLEGELRYLTPIGGTDFAGDMVRYGLGISYGQRSSSDIWLMPVVEAVGWTALNGQEYVTYSPTTFSIQEAAGDTIVNVQAGLRWGFGQNADIYAGYGRGVSGDRWFRDYFRLDIRFLF